MANWTKPLYRPGVVDRAGALLLKEIQGASPGARPSDDDLNDAFLVVRNWRASFSYPLNTYQTGLRNRARAIDPHAVVAQRLKRMVLILVKLQRFRTMHLTTMGDIGGCRALERT